MKRLLTLCLLLSAVLAAADFDARYLDMEIRYNLNADGSWDREYRHRVRLDSYAAINRYLGETFIVYNPDFQRLEILKCQTTMADGRQVPAPENAFNEVLPFAAHGFADFSRLREMVVTHTALERGAVVELHYRLHTQAGLLPVFSGVEPLVQDFPVDRYRLTVKVPAGHELNCRASEASVSVAQVQETDGKVYAVSLQNLQPASREPLQHALAKPYVVFSAAADWKQVSAAGDDSALLPAAFVERIQALQSKKNLRSDLLNALQQICAQEIQNCLLEADSVGWRPRSADRVLASNYGTGLEKARLLKAMLAAAGVDCEMLAVFADPFAMQVPAVQQVKGYWLKLADDSGVWFIDPCKSQDGVFRFALAATAAWNLQRNEAEALPVPGEKDNRVELSGSLALGGDGVSGLLRVTAKGSFLRYDEAAADAGNFIAGLLRTIFPVDKVELVKLDRLTREELCAEVQLNGKWLLPGSDGDGKAEFLTVAPFRLPMLQEGMVQPENRRTILQLEAPFAFALNLELTPEKGLYLEYAPADLSGQNEFGRFSRTLARDGNGTLRASLSCGISRAQIAVQDYPKLRRVLLPGFSPGPWLLFRKNP